MDRVHACLDGEIAREELNAAELSRLARMESALEATAGVLRSAPAPDLTAAVMRSLPAAHSAPAPVPSRAEVAAGWWQRAREWAWKPRTLTVRYRPAYAVAGFAMAALAAVLVPQSLPSNDPSNSHW